MFLCTSKWNCFKTVRKTQPVWQHSSAEEWCLVELVISVLLGCFNVSVTSTVSLKLWMNLHLPCFPFLLEAVEENQNHLFFVCGWRGRCASSFKAMNSLPAFSPLRAGQSNQGSSRFLWSPEETLGVAGGVFRDKLFIPFPCPPPSNPAWEGWVRDKGEARTWRTSGSRMPPTWSSQALLNL